ncbi:Cna B-type domain-containing protein [Candidatus Saccharibacteria bacterium]|nr:Cna B-type domain-containing protein [Candidatus Saccharibacteria bacterium]
MKIKKKTNIKLLFASLLLVLGFAFHCIPATAASSKVIVTDKDNDKKISVGDEFCLKTECFYVTKNADGKISAMSKYNLYVGSNYDKVTVDINTTYVKQVCKLQSSGSYYCSTFNPGAKYFVDGAEVSGSQEWLQAVLSKYGLSEVEDFSFPVEVNDSNGDKAYVSTVVGEQYEENGVRYQNYTYKLYPYVTITKNTKGYALQNELARGVTGDKGKANYPIYATMFLFNDGLKLSSFAKSLDNFTNGYTNFELKDSVGEISEDGPDLNVIRYLSDYQNKLNDFGYSVDDVDMISISELNELVRAISGENLPLADWYNASGSNEENHEDYLTDYKVLGDIKEYVDDDYSWIWNTSYWMKTLYGNITDIDTETYFGRAPVYFVSTQGEICYSQSDCWASIPRAGLRPIITMAANNFELNLMDINGTVRWIDNNNSSKIRPKKSVIKLYRNGVFIEQVEVEKDEDEDLWRFSFHDLLKYDENGNEYVYTITQDDVPQYSSDITNFDVVNQYAQNPKTSASSPMIFGGVLGLSALAGALLLHKQRR